MRAVVVTRQGNPVTPNIRFQTDWPDLPPPKSGWVNVRALASAFNHMDLWVGMGIPGVNLIYPRVSGCDCCGVVDAVGPGVDTKWVGRRVIVNAATRVPDSSRPGDPPGTTLAPNYELIGEHHNGMFAEFFSIPADNLAAIPESIDVADGAAFGLCALTAYSMMVTKARIVPGQSVLITGIGGGVAAGLAGAG